MAILQAPGMAGCDSESGVGYASMAADCDDSNPAVNPGMEEICSESLIDENCDGSLLESEWYRDVDGDTFGDEEGVGQIACEKKDG